MFLASLICMYLNKFLILFNNLLCVSAKSLSTRVFYGWVNYRRYRFSPDNNHFSFHLCMSPNYILPKMLDFTDI